MKALLFDDKYVEIVPESAKDCGSFRISVGNASAYNRDLLRFFYGKLVQVSMPWFIDVGANTGAFTLLASHIPQARVFALEPNRDIFQLLRDNCKANAQPAVILSYAAWDKDCMLTFHAHEAHGYSRVQYRFAGGETASYEVMARSLDSLSVPYGIGRLDFLKIDVEGAELRVLKGAEGLIDCHHPAIFLEWWEPHCKQFGYHPSEIDQWLAAKGYSKQPIGHYAYYTMEEA